MHNFIAYQVALKAARQLAGCLTAIGRKDRDLERQMRRAGQSIEAQLGRGQPPAGQGSRALFSHRLGQRGRGARRARYRVGLGLRGGARGRAGQAAARSPVGYLLAAHRAGRGAAGQGSGLSHLSIGLELALAWGLLADARCLPVCGGGKWRERPRGEAEAEGAAEAEGRGRGERPRGEAEAEAEPEAESETEATNTCCHFLVFWGHLDRPWTWPWPSPMDMVHSHDP